MDSRFAIEIKNANLFIEGRQILTDLNWQVKNGEHCFVLGPNGAGKTTLTRMLMGYIWPMYGAEISLFGNRYGTCNIFELRKNIAWVSPYLGKWASAATLNVLDVILSGVDSTIGLFRHPSKSETEKALNFLSVLDCEYLADKLFLNLSSGEQVKVLIGRSLMTNPRLMILDEACAHLDLKSREFLLNTVAKLSKINNSPVIIFVTQRLEDIIPELETGIIIKNGRIVKSGNRDQILTEENLQLAFDIPIKIVKTDNGRLWPIIGA